MSEHVDEWLGPYLDRELSNGRRRRMESHLAGCNRCRKELKALRSLSRALHSDLPPEMTAPSGQFATGLVLRLPPRPEAAARKKTIPGGWLVPGGILGSWVCLQILAGMTSLASAAWKAGLFGSLTALVQNDSFQASWTAAVVNLFGTQLGETTRSVLGSLDQANLIMHNLTVQFAWQFLLAAAYWVWLILWQKRSGQLGLPARMT